MPKSRFANRGLTLLGGCVALLLSASLPCLHGESSQAGNGALPEIFDERHCGINALFIAIRLTGQKITYAEIFNAFPQVPNEGLSIRELQDFLRSHNLKAESRWLNSHEFSELGLIGIVRVPASDSAGRAKNRYHYIVARCSSPTAIQVIDPPFMPMIGNVLSPKADRMPIVLLSKMSIPSANKVGYEFGMCAFLVSTGTFVILCYLRSSSKSRDN